MKITRTKIPIEISARHVHLSQRDLERLFGKGYNLKVLYPISQPGQFAAKEEVELINGPEKLKARILGPVRKNTQIEVSITDSFRLKFNSTPKIKLSGNLNDSGFIVLEGPKGKVKTNGVIIAKRHLHLSESEAKKLNLKDGQNVKIKIMGERGLIFDNVIVRAGEGNKFAFQIDTDEGNAAGISNKTKTYGELIS